MGRIGGIEPQDGLPKGGRFSFWLTVPKDALAFTSAFTLLVASFYVLPDQAGRNILLYLAAALAHAFLVRERAIRTIFSAPGGRVVLLLAVVPAASLLWSRDTTADVVKDLLLGAYCIVAVYFGLAWVLRSWPKAQENLAGLMLVGGSLAGAAAIVYWMWAGPQAGSFRLEGIGGIDNPVHASVLLLGGTLPVLVDVLGGRRGRAWLSGLIVPVCFAALAGARTAVVAYLLVGACILIRHRPRLLIWSGVALLMTAAVIVFLIGSGAQEIWLGRGWSYRDVIWKEVWAAYRECNPFVGCGIGTPLVIPVADVVGSRAHSIYFGALYYQGIFGLLVLLACVGWLLLSKPAGLRGVDESAAGWAWVLLLALLASVSSGDHLLVRASLFWLVFWVPVMIVAANAGRESSTRLRS